MKPVINRFPEKYIFGSKRAILCHVSSYMYVSDRVQKCDWFVGHGKEEHHHLEGTWMDMIYLARAILASENTKLTAPGFYKPELKIEEYTETPYEFKGE